MPALHTLPTYLKVLLIVATGAIQPLALSPFNYWITGPVSIALFIALTGALNTEKKSFGCAFLQGWLLGFGLFAAGASWVYVSINTYGNAPPALASFLTLLFVAGLGLFHALFFAVFNCIKGSSAAINALIFASLWVLNDLFRGWFLTGFPWLYLGDSQLEGPLSPLIPVGGVHSATFLVVVIAALAIASLPASTSQAFDRLRLASFTGLILTLFIAISLMSNIQWTKPTGNSLRIAAIQLNIAQEDKWKASQKPKTIRLLKDLSAKQWDKDIVFWPETAIPIMFNRAKPVIDHFASQAVTNNTAIVTGIPYRGWDPNEKRFIYHNSILSMGEGQGLYHKQKLVPFGEYVPLQELLRGLIAFFDLPMSDFRKGSSDQKLLQTRGYSLAPFICYEVVYPDFVAKQAKNADYLVTISNDAWFGQSIGPLQHLEIAQMRALENGRYMVRATNNGVTAIINHKGEITESIPQFEQGVLEGEIEIVEGQTPFNKLGSWPIVILCLSLVLWHLIQGRKPRNKVTPAT